MAQITEALERAETLPDWGIEPVPPDKRALSGVDMGLLWGNLGISILLPVTGALLIQLLELSFRQALLAIVVGAVIGNLMLAAAARIGADTGAPTMVTYRGPLGIRGSYLPTIFNVMQNVGWGAFELYIISVVMAGLLDRYTGRGLRPLWVVVFAAVCILMAVGGPVAVVRRWIRRYAVWIVLASSTYLTVYMLVTYDLSAFWNASGSGGSANFWQGVDLVIALPVSWIPLVCDYTRFARTGRGAFWGAGIGYLIANVWFYLIGVLLLLGTPGADAFDPAGFVAALFAIPVGWLAMLILAVDETDEAFANIYSASVSVQNVFPRLSQRALSVAFGVICGALALVVNLVSYENFLFLLGALFVPLFGVLFADYYRLGIGGYPKERLYGRLAARFRPSALLAWLVGFLVYNWINPGTVSWWVDAMDAVLGWLPDAPSWAGASLASFVVAGVLTIILVPAQGRHRYVRVWKNA
ncbi:MAG: purine-cytosine permease family protein [Actinomycetota bacterium]